MSLNNKKIKLYGALERTISELDILTKQLLEKTRGVERLKQESPRRTGNGYVTD